ncbi:hypothetical protein EYZ11_013065 [Aspergillus tanneri]|uniref:C2H2-type domain-containing protein n=1 Tax=Aspergillus tanneri TaxID=1220188 RepID=A0A4S3IYL7_9EURO|nr:hypothetical protein EYZ11_013065 [Aspergillus tanneri]
MSTLSPQFIRDDSTANMMLQDANLSESYLSTTLDPDEVSFKSSVIRFTPSNDDDHGPKTSASPMDFHPNSDSNHDAHHPASYSDFLSPVDDFSSDLSPHTSPNPNLSSGFGIDMPPDSGWQPDMHTVASDTSEMVSPRMTMNPSQLLTPNLTNIPSPSSDISSVKKSNGVVEGLSVCEAPDSARAISPIVKVESYSRGDSPVRDTFCARRRPSQSSTHLSPCDVPSDSEDEDRPGDPGYGFSPSVSRTHDGSWIPNAATGQAGVDPTSRDDIYLPSPSQMEWKRQLDDKNEDIRSWSASVSVASIEAGDEAPAHRGRRGPTGTRRRAKSAGDPSLQQEYFNTKSASIPGPGILVHEISDDEDSEYESVIDGSSSDSPAVPVGETRWTNGDLVSSPTMDRPLSQGEDEEPSPHQFLRTPPWKDPARDPSPRTARTQPQSSTAAIVEFERRARDIDTASRSATWGTRPLSEVEVNSIIGAGGSFEHLSIDQGKKHQRGSSLRKFLHRKPSSSLKRHLSDLSLTHPSTDNAGKGDEVRSPQRKDSFPHRKLSLGRSRSPSLSTGGAVIAIAGQMAAIGGKDSIRAASPNTTVNPWSSLKARGRSRSEIPRASAPGLVDLMTSHGGPPVANIAYSPRPSSGDPPPQQPQPGPAPNTVEDDDDDDDEKALVMEFPVHSRLPVPTLDGFRTQITQLNPRLPPALIERFANEQLRRYKKLVESKLSHTRAVQHNKCSSGKFCFAQGGEATILAPRTSPQDPDAVHTQFHIPGRGEADDDPQSLGEGAVTAAQFPPGVPLPPVKRLPAEFECPICFHVKKFQKPSDWTKHVHEDVQPFTCTFPHCTDPKSFKRKADWVRHESERHRKLEWWTCTVPDCNHTCYRKDNFVQHLVREHKMPEPKVKKSKTKGSGKPSGGPDAQEEYNREREIEQLWDLVERCRHDTAKGPKEEPCRFCGNICSSWKKLTVHLAKHMEQIAMPVLGLVNERDLSSNPGLGPAAKTDVPSTDFAPNISGEASMNFTQAQYPPGTASGELTVPFHPTYVPHLTNGLLSAEPEPMDAYDVTPYGATVGLPPGEHLDQSRLVPVHQNSVTYPPPFNAGPRPRVSNPNWGVFSESYQAPSLTPMEINSTYPAGPLCMSSAAEDRYAGPGPVAQGMPFEPSGTYRTQL